MNGRKIPDHTKALAKEMWNKGASSNLISIKLGMTRAAVMGLIRRMRQKDPTIKRYHEFSSAIKASKGNSRRKSPIKSEYLKPAPEFKIPKKVSKSERHWVPLLSLADNTCRYTKDGKLFCNAITIPNSNYCNDHHNIIYAKSTYTPKAVVPLPRK